MAGMRSVSGMVVRAAVGFGEAGGGGAGQGDKGGLEQGFHRRRLHPGLQPHRLVNGW
jgi:hypothetical protein